MRPATHAKIFEMRAYGSDHLLWLAAISAFGAALAVSGRRSWVPLGEHSNYTCVMLVGGELQRYFHDGVAFPDRVPLHLCNVTTWVAVLACLTLGYRAVEFTYFAGLAGAGMAVLTPDMGAVWPPGSS